MNHKMNFTNYWGCVRCPDCNAVASCKESLARHVIRRHAQRYRAGAMVGDGVDSFEVSAIGVNPRKEVSYGRDSS